MNSEMRIGGYALGANACTGNAISSKISLMICRSVSFAIVCGVLATANRRADADAVTASRVCADNIVAIST